MASRGRAFASDAFAQATIEALSAHVCVLDASGAIIAVNRAWREFARKNPPSLQNAWLGANYLKICEGVKGNEAAEAAAFVKGTRAVLNRRLNHFNMEYPCHSQHEQRWFIVRVTRFTNRGATYVVVAHENITARKLAEAAVQKSEEHMRLAMSAAPLGTWEWNIDTGELYWSDNLWAMFGVKPTGKMSPDFALFRDAIHPDDRARVLQAIDETLRHDAPYHLEMRIVKPDGTTRWALTHGRVIRDEAGRPKRMIGVDMDITDRKLAQLEREAIPEKIMAAVEEERRRVARDLHDGIGQVLSSARLRLASLLESTKDAQCAQCVHEPLKLVDKSVREVQRIARNLRPSELDHLGLPASIRSLCAGIQERLGLRVNLRLGDSGDRLDPKIELALFRILQEALRNVEQHARAKRVQVSLARRDGGVALTIVDNGRGLQPAKTRRGSSKHTGMGMINMRERATQLGGTFEAVALTRGGTEISVWIPIGKHGKQGSGTDER